MEASTLNILAEILLILLSSTLGASILLMIGGANIFKKASKKPVTVYYPIVNLFTLLEITELSIFLGILFFVPGLNIIALMIMFFKLGSVFGCNGFFKLGLAIFPVICYPILSLGNKQYKLNDQEYFKMLDNTRKKDLNLMTEKEIQQLNTEPVVEEPQVDSIFKEQTVVDKTIEPYKAVRIDLIGVEKLKTADINSKVNEVSNKNDQSEKTQFDMKEIKEEKPKKDDNIEYVDL
jgi:hypothetical protein